MIKPAAASRGGPFCGQLRRGSEARVLERLFRPGRGRGSSGSSAPTAWGRARRQRRVDPGEVAHRPAVAFARISGDSEPGRKQPQRPHLIGPARIGLRQVLGHVERRFQVLALDHVRNRAAAPWSRRRDRRAPAAGRCACAGLWRRWSASAAPPAEPASIWSGLCAADSLAITASSSAWFPGEDGVFVVVAEEGIEHRRGLRFTGTTNGTTPRRQRGAKLHNAQPLPARGGAGVGGSIRHPGPAGRIERFFGRPHPRPLPLRGGEQVRTSGPKIRERLLQLGFRCSSRTGRTWPPARATACRRPRSDGRRV